MDELKVSWDDNTCKLIHKKHHHQSYHNDIKYRVTLDTIFSVLGKCIQNLKVAPPHVMAPHKKF
jgi:hypothetical protein